MKYPLREKIGKPELLVGREQEFDNFNKWISNIPECLSDSRVILARRKAEKLHLYSVFSTSSGMKTKM